MGGDQFRRRLRFLWFRRRSRNPNRWMNDAPRPPPIPATDRISDASSALTDVTAVTTVSTADLRSTRNSALDAVCLICLDDLPIGSSRIKLPTCAHGLWHAHCVRTWLRHAPRCPLCAAAVAKSARARVTAQLSDMDDDNDDNGDADAHGADQDDERGSRALPATIMPSASCPPASRMDAAMPVRDLAWTLSERRMHERTMPDLPTRLSRLSSHDVEWFLYDRRLSRVSRPVRRQRYPRLSSLSNTFSIVRR